MIVKIDASCAMVENYGLPTRASPLRAGQQARIVKVVDLTLWVEPQD